MSATDTSLVLTVAVSSALVAVVLYVWTALALGAVFRKSGEQAWKAWVPILNLVVLLQLGGFSGWLVLLLLLPVVGPLLIWVAIIVACHRIGRAFGFGGGMTVLAAFLFPVWASVVGFGSARWVGSDDLGPRRTVNPDLGGSVSGSGAAGRGAVDDFDERAYGVPTSRGAVYTPLLPAPDDRSADSRDSDRDRDRDRAIVDVGAGAEDGAEPDAEKDDAGSTDPRTPEAVVRTPADPDPDDGRDDVGVPSDTAALFARPEPPRFTPPETTGPVWPSVEPFRPVRSWDPEPTPSAEDALAGSPAADHPAAGSPAAGSPAAAVVAEAAIEVPAAPTAEPPAPSRAETRRAESVWHGFVLDQDVTGEVTGAVTGAPAPISAVPQATRPAAPAAEVDDDEPPIRRRSTADADLDDDAPEIPVFQAPLTRVPAPAPTGEPAADEEAWRPAPSPMPEAEPFPETSGPVSAIAGAPTAGSPRSATGAVSAQHPRPGVPALDDGLDQTIIARRRRTSWAVVTPAGESIAISSDVAILGRKPAKDPDHPRAQLIRIDDSTVSSTHARLELRHDTWYITDLGSTNGVVFATLMGTEVEAPSGVEVEAGDRFFLGDAEIRLVRSDR
jgi:hypothetical protein